MIKRSIIPVLCLAVPLATWPGFYNAYFSPKVFVIVTLACLMVCLNYFKTFDKYVIALIALNIVNLFYTQNPYYTHIAVILNISCLLFFQFTKDNVTEKDIEIIFSVICLTGVIVSVLAIFNWFGVHPITYTGNRKLYSTIISTIGNSNFIGCYLLFPLFTSLYLTRVYKWFISYPVMAVISVGLIVSRGRASWLGAAIGVTVFLFLVCNRKNAIKIMALCMITGAVVLSFPVHLHWQETKSLSVRMKYWQGSVRLWMDSPLFGTGMWSYRNRVYEAYKSIIKKEPNWMEGGENKPRRAHNMYLETLNDGGMLYFFVLMGFFASAFIKAIQHLKHTVKEKRFLMASAFSCIIALMVSGFFFFPLRAPSSLVMIFVMLGVIHAIDRYTVCPDNMDVSRN